MSQSLNVVRVNILGQQYVIKTSADASYINKVADYVNERMDEVKQSAGDDQSQLRTAVLASMNITDELFTDRKEHDIVIDKIEAKTLAITEFIEDKIKETENK
ncbi:MAG: cell division protein ZapA [Candidatus Marinimicrobia bacterium]|nr:cell division protein ZapA [Candidatus Neomarinimicrobiota bacterium]MBL7022771.1 cell division protein ZapA [Candidatus Neomarinimicrobiota bacterium]MBL7109708.1 cell division protein ZapA [Candidatus Neomarinimicrobiota bacterium]